MNRFLLAALALAVLFPTSASAQLTRVGNPTSADAPPLARALAAVDDLRHRNRSTGDRSGSGGDLTEDVIVPQGAWVTHIEMGERSNQPCGLTVEWASIDNGNLTTGTRVWTTGCSPTRSSVKRLGRRAQVPGGSQPDLRLHVIRGLRVCQRTSNDRVKGLEIRSGSINNLSTSYARVRDMTISESYRRFERPNCNDWEDDFEMCSGNRVLVGVEISAVRQPNQIRGLAPICARLRIQR